jgi:hypothetical protein
VRSVHNLSTETSITAVFDNPFLVSAFILYVFVLQRKQIAAMSHHVHLVIRTEGESSDREWEVEAVSSTLDRALDLACSLAAKLFTESNENKIWGQFWPPYTIHTFTVDDNTAPSSMIVTLNDIRERHPELDPIIEARAQACSKTCRNLACSACQWRKGPGAALSRRPAP